MRHLSRNGFVLLYAVLVSATVLSIGSGIFAIGQKEITLSAAGRDSQKAFFTADAGAECAFFWDRRYFFNSSFTVSVFASSTDSPSVISGVRCDTQDVAANGGAGGGVWTVSNLTPTTATTAFTLTFADGSCARVTVAKNAGLTTVTSTGLSICNESDPRTIRRVVVSGY